MELDAESAPDKTIWHHALTHWARLAGFIGFGAVENLLMWKQVSPAARVTNLVPLVGVGLLCYLGMKQVRQRIEEHAAGTLTTEGLQMLQDRMGTPPERWLDRQGVFGTPLRLRPVIGFLQGVASALLLNLVFASLALL